MKAIDDEQIEQGKRDEKRAQIEGLQVEINSPIHNKPVKLVPINSNPGQLTEAESLERAKERQRSILSSLTYDLMNPVVLVQKGKDKRKEHKKRHRESIMHHRTVATDNSPPMLQVPELNPLDSQLSDLGITDINVSRQQNNQSIAAISI